MQIKTDEFQKEMKEHGNYCFPLLVSHEKLSQYESGGFLWHWHPEIELTLVTRGHMIYKVNSLSFLLCEGQALFGNSAALHSGYMSGSGDCEYISITFDPKLIFGYENSIIYMNYVKPIIQNLSFPACHFNLSEKWHEQILELIRDIILLHASKSPAYELDIVSRLNEFWKLLFLNTEHASCENFYDKRIYYRIREIISYIEKNYGSNMTLADIADSIHVSRSECSRMFRKYMNISLFEFITQYRIERSVEYLMNTNCSVTEIAALTGFNDSNYFAKVFKKQKGYSPTRQRGLQGCSDIFISSSK